MTLRDHHGRDGSPKPMPWRGQRRLRWQLLSGFEVCWAWRQSRRPVQDPTPASDEPQRAKDRVRDRDERSSQAAN
jgi:hypothetical protein